LKLENRPIHFREIYQRLHQLAQVEDELIHHSWHRRYNLKSIKNELIKHSDFVLVGRGTYALKEWGLIGGTAKELILKFLKKEKKIRKEKLWQIISKLRPIKKSSFTIYLNEIKNLRQENDYLIYHD
jgi:DNA-directed RNA polymerase delta subunit